MPKPIKPLKKDADLGEKEVHAKENKLKPTGEQHNPLPWVEPFPTSKMSEGDHPEETVFVRATIHQDIILNGVQYKAGQKTLPCGFAHQHAACLSAPK